jgi:hypothetical protein
MFFTVFMKYNTNLYFSGKLPFSLMRLSLSCSSPLEHSGVDRISSSELLSECWRVFLPRLFLWGFGGGGRARLSRHHIRIEQTSDSPSVLENVNENDRYYDKQHLDPSTAATGRNSQNKRRQKLETMMFRNDSLSSDPSDCARPPPPKPHKNKRGKKTTRCSYISLSFLRSLGVGERLSFPTLGSRSREWRPLGCRSLLLVWILSLWCEGICCLFWDSPHLFDAV